MSFGCSIFLLIFALDEPPHPTRPASRASRDVTSHRSSTPTPRPTTPIRAMDSPHHSRSTSQHSSERRPMGPRSPSPLPPKSPLLLPSEMPDADMTLEKTLVDVTQPSTPIRTESVTSSYRRSNRQPFLPTGNTDVTQKHSTSAVPSSIEPLSIKKKTSVRTSTTLGSPTSGRKTFTRNSPLNRASARIASPRRVSPQVRTVRTTAHHSGKSADAERIIRLAQTTKEDVRMFSPSLSVYVLKALQIESSHRAVKRIRLELDGFQSNAPRSGPEDHWRPSSPVKGLPRTPQRGIPVGVT